MPKTTNNKQVIKDLALGLGFGNVSVGSLEPLLAPLEHYKIWLDRGYAATMEYMKRDPERRCHPGRTSPRARSAILVSVSYFSLRPEKPGPFYGSVALYAVGRDYHEVIPQRLSILKERIEEALACRVEGFPFVDDVPLYEQAYAARHGLGFAGKNTMVIGPRLSGSYNFVAELFTDLELEPDFAYEGTCGNCFRCGSACPTGAIVEPGFFVDSRACISFLTIENKGAIEPRLREGMGNWLFGCDICQEVCPYNQRHPESPWEELGASQGAGHYIELGGILDISGRDEFRSRFSHTPLSRPRLRGLKRNALVVSGNELAGLPSGSLKDEWIERLYDFAAGEPDALLKEHAIWALSRSGTRWKVLAELAASLPEPERDLASSYL